MKKCVLIYLISLAKSLIVFTKKQQQTVEFVLLLGFTIMAAEETPYLPGPWEINQPFVMWHLKNELGLWSLWRESLVQIMSLFQLIYHQDLNQRPTEKPTIRSLVLTPIKSGRDSRRINQNKSLWNILNLSQLSQAHAKLPLSRTHLKHYWHGRIFVHKVRISVIFNDVFFTNYLSKTVMKSR